MAYATDRIILFDRNMIPLDEIGPNEIFSRVRTEELNGEHSLVLITTRRLQEGWRALTVDGSGKWREWVVSEIDEEHVSGKHMLGTYHLVWSLQYDLTMAYTHTHSEIGYGNSLKTAQGAATLICKGTSWGAGNECDAPDVPEGSGAVFIYESAWSKLSKTVECMGCEVDAAIRVTSVAEPDYDLTTPFYIERFLNLRAHVGSEVALRRFDWNEDLTSIKRIPDPGPYYCRVVPLGKRENGKEYADDGKTEFDWPLDITEETGTKEEPGPYYIEDEEAALAFRRMNSAGTWEYPTKAVSYDEDDPELLLKAAQEDLHNHTRPGVTYEASVLQLARAGMDVQGVALGDEVQVVDYGFNPDAGLRIQGRVVKIEVDELSPETTTTLTIGQLRDDITDTINKALGDLNTSISSTSNVVSHMSTADYVNELIDRINTEINAGGGYTYLVPGEGLIVYNKAVADPLIGSEAESVVQIKNGGIRIANSRKDQFAGIDDWNWRTVFTSGHIAAEVVTAAQITTGYIGSANAVDANGHYTGTGNYINFDSGETHLATQLSSRNIIRNGSFALGTDFWKSSTGVTLVVEEDSTYGHHLKATQSYSGSTSRCLYPDTSTSFTHEKSTTYTLTFWAKASGNNKLYVSRAGAATDRYVDGEDVGTDWKQFIATLTSTGTGSLMFWLNTSGVLYLADVMMVVGNSSFGFSENPEDMGQEGILYRLTGGYANEGLYINSGHLYINASYIHGGTFVAGGANNVNGVIEVRNASNTTVCRFDKDGADINGKITSTSGNIGGFTIGTSSLYNNRSTLTGGTSGVYISTSGISTGSGTSWIAMSQGNLYGGAGSSQYGYLSFNHSFSGTGSGHGPRLAGNGGIALLCGSLVIGDYVNISSSGTGKAGKTITINSVPYNFTASWNTHNIAFSDGQTVSNLCQNLSMSWSTANLAFTKGILT